MQESVPATSIQDRLNVVLITLDTVRPDHLGCYGYTRARTPHMDWLARAGTLFDQAITNGSYTKPAFPAILSSTYASMYGGPFAAVDRQRPMLARLLQARGYRTGGFTPNPLLGTRVGYGAGFDAFEEPVPPPDHRSWLRIKGAQPLLCSERINSTLMKLGLDTSPHPMYVEADAITRLACDWLAKQGRPIFLWIHYMDAHWPYHTLASLQTGPSRARAWADLGQAWRSRKSHPGNTFVERLKRLYDEGIAHIDYHLGCLLDGFDRGGFARNTAVIIAADHGEAFYEHGRWGHGAVCDLHEEILRVPLIIYVPGFPAGRRVTRQVCLLDVAPTILELLGIDVDTRMEGQSLLPDLGGSSPPLHRLTISEMVAPDWYCVALRTEQYKYIYDERRPEQPELYDLLADPRELKDLNGNQPDVEASFEAALKAHLQRVVETGGRCLDGRWERDEEIVARLRALGYIE